MGSRLFVVGFVCLLVTGCGPRLPLVPVTGSVKMKGEPLSGAIVVFAPQTPVDGVMRVSSAVTDAGGRFALQTNYSPRSTGRGAIPGSFKVTVAKSVSGTSLPPADYRKHLAEHRKRMGDRLLFAGPEEEKDFSIQLVPHQYTSVATTPLSAKVASGQANEFTFAID